MEENSLEEKCRMLKKIQIVGRYQCLGTEIKGRKERIAQISKEITNLWKNKLNFPHVSNQVIQAKLEKVMKVYDECVRRGKYDALNELFDITKVKGFWLSSEDKRLYYLQVESKGEVGYCQAQLASKKSIHPSKRQKLQAELPSTSRDFAFDCHALSSTESENSEYNEEEESTPKPTRKYNSSKLASDLVISTGVSVNKASKIFKHLTDGGLATPSPSQFAIYKADLDN